MSLLSNVTGDKPIEFKISIDPTTSVILGATIILAIVCAYYFLKGINSITATGA